MPRSSIQLIAIIAALLLLGSMFYLALPIIWTPVDASQPDIIIYNGDIITMEDSSVQVEAVAIRNGTIVAVGSETEILAMVGSNTSIMDLDGRTLLPGFIDSHTHDMGDRNLTNQTTPEEVIEHLLSSGWTSISELFVNQDRLDNLRALDQEGELRIRVNAYLPLSWQFERFGDWYKAYEPGQVFSSKLRIGGVKIFMDGSYVYPIHFFNQTELEQLVQEAHDAGFQIAVHSIVDNSTDVVLDAFESVLGSESNDLYRHRIEHLILLRDDQIQRMSDLGILASIQMSWFTSDWRDAGSFPLLDSYPHLVARWYDLLDAGVPCIGSTDYPWNQPDVRSAPKVLSFAVTRVGTLGYTPTSWMLDQRLSVEQALHLLTIDAAYGTFQEDIKGSIKVGKLADLVVLSDNPLTIPTSSIADLDVELTMIGGVIEYSSPDFMFMNSTVSRLVYGRTEMSVSYLTGESLMVGVVPLNFEMRFDSEDLI